MVSSCDSSSLVHLASQQSLLGLQFGNEVFMLSCHLDAALHEFWPDLQTHLSGMKAPARWCGLCPLVGQRDYLALDRGQKHGMPMRLSLLCRMHHQS